MICYQIVLKDSWTHNLFVRNLFDKHIARRYDRLTGSLYFLTVIAQWKDGLHTEADLAEFSPEVREMIERMRMP